MRPKLDGRVSSSRPGAPDILVVEPGNPRTYDMVAALGAEGFSLRFATRYFHDPAGTVERVARRIGGPDMERWLMRRYHPAIPPGSVDGSVGAELVDRLARRLAPQGWGERMAAGWLDRRAARLARRLRPRAVVALDSYGLASFAAARELGIPSVLDQSTGFVGAAAALLAEERARFPELAGSIHLPSPRVVAHCRAEAGAADLILAPSAYARDTLTAIGVDEARIALVPYGVDTQKFAPPPATGRLNKRPFRVLFVGRISPPKGVHYLLEAFRAAALPDAELVLAGTIVGDGGWLARYRGLYRHVPSVPHGEAAELYRGADVLVFPTLHDGFGLVVLEAMASGLPVILTPHAADVVRDGEDGYVVPIRDAAAIADRLRLMQADPALCRRMGESARARAEAYGLDRYARGLAAALRPLISPGAC